MAVHASQMSEGPALERVLRRNRATVLLALAGVTALSWVCTVRLGWEMSHADTATHGANHAVPYLVQAFAMWAVMMVGMMVPCAAPCVLGLASASDRRSELPRAMKRTAAFLSGYIVAWTAFSLLAALAQWGLHRAALIGPRMASTSPLLGGALLLAAGAFEFTALKSACLRRCRSGWQGLKHAEFRAGLEHGVFSVGCCWLLMLILFVTGVMSFLWMAIITAFMLLEKLTPESIKIGRLAGAFLIGWGGWMLLGALG